MLTKLLQTSFVHAVDAPSLALVCPILARAMKDRSSDVKKKASQIVGGAANKRFEVSKSSLLFAFPCPKHSEFSAKFVTSRGNAV